MADCTTYTLSSNQVGASLAEEECLKELPTAPVWLQLEPNSFSDFGNELNKVTRNPINPSRQRRKGRTVGAEATAGYQTDVTATSINRLVQGFLFADAREAASTKALRVPVGSVKVNTVAVAGVKIDDANTVPMTWGVGALVNMSGFANASNNGLKRITAIDPTNGLAMSPGTVAETVTGSQVFTKTVETVGYEYAAGDVQLTVTSGIPALVATAGNFTKPGLIPGAWIFIGGDAAGTQLGTNVGYARIKSVAAKSLVFDETTFTPAAYTGVGKTARIFVGSCIRNEKDPSLMIQRSYQMERTLGINPTSDAAQAEYAIGAIASELTINVPSEDKLTADIGFMACDIEYRSGAAGDEVKAGDRVEVQTEEAFNSTSDIVRMRVNVKDASVVNPVALTGFVQEATVTVNNNVSGNKAIGVFGNLDFNIGTLEAGGSITAYFADVATLKAIRNDLDVEFNAISAFDNKGFVIELPLLTVTGGALSIEADSPVTLPIEMSAVEGEHGFTMLYQSFAYLPNVAMPA